MYDPAPTTPTLIENKEHGERVIVCSPGPDLDHHIYMDPTQVFKGPQTRVPQTNHCQVTWPRPDGG